MLSISVVADWEQGAERLLRCRPGRARNRERAAAALVGLFGPFEKASEQQLQVLRIEHPIEQCIEYHLVQRLPADRRQRACIGSAVRPVLAGIIMIATALAGAYG